MMGLLGSLASLGQPGRDLAYRIDLARALGPRDALRRFREERADGTTPSDSGYQRIWADAAQELGAELIALGSGFFEFRKDGRTTRAWQYCSPLDDPVTLKLALDKTLVHRLLAEAGVPVPEHVEFDATGLGPAIAFLERGPRPCVVKPVTSSFGSGVTGGIETRSQLERATWRASRVSGRLLIERQAEGAVYRLLFLDGRLIDVIRRFPPAVIGDGSSTIAELVDIENRRRAESQEDRAPALLRIDLDAVFALERAETRLHSTPARGAQVRLKTVVSQNSALENETVRVDVSELADEALAAVRRVGLRLAGVDAVTTDPTRSLRATGGVILEVNGTPGLHYHYEVADPEHATRVAIPVLQAMLS
jgi:cyanophycin synthetase